VLCLQVPPGKVRRVRVTVQANARKCDVKFKLFDIVFAFLLNDFWIENACAHQAGLEGGHGCTLEFPALGFAQLHVEPERALRSLLRSRLLADATDHVTDVRGVSVVIGKNVEGGRVAVNQVVHFVGDVDGDRDGAIDLIGTNRDGDAVRRVLADLRHEARHALFLRGRRVQRGIRACFEETFDRVGLRFTQLVVEGF